MKTASSIRCFGPFVRALAPAALIALTLAGFVRVREQHDADDAFRDAAAQRLAQVSDRVHAAVDGLRALGGYFDASGHVAAAQFTRLSAPLLAQGVPIQALEWVPRVTAEQRPGYVAAARTRGLAQFEFTARDLRGQLVRETARPVYYPVYYVNPLAGNRKAIGFDLASKPDRYAALQRAMRSGRMAATGRITLVQETANEYGFLVFRPVYAGGAAPSSTAGRAAALTGFVLGVFRVGDLIGEAPGAGASRIALQLYDDDAPPEQRLLYPKGAAPWTATHAPNARSKTQALRIGGRHWTVVARPAPGAFVPNRTASSAVLALGLLASLLWAFYVRLRASRMAAIEQAVIERTRDLEEQRGFSAAIFDSLGGIGLVLDREGAIVRFNRAAEAFTGYTEAEVEGRPMFWTTFVPPDERAAVTRVHADFKLAHVPRQVENHWVNRAGETRLFAWTNTAIDDGRGAPLYLVTMGRDITESRQVQRQLELERVRYRSILQTASDGIHILDRDGLLVEANDAFLAMLGYDSGDVGRRSVFDWDCGSTPAQLEGKLEALLQSDQSQLFETRHRHRDGRVLDVEISARRVRIDGALYLYGASRDIAARKRVQAALAASEQRYRQFFENNTAVKLIIDAETGQIVDANSTAVAFYGYARARLLAMHIVEINCLAPDELAHELACAREERRLHFNFRHRLASGQVRDVEVYTGPTLSDGRKLLYSIVHDVTERHAAIQLRNALLENTTSGILIARRRTVIEVNGAMLQMLGVARSACVGRSARALYPDDEAFMQVGVAYDALHAHGTASVRNVRIAGADARVLLCDLRGRLLPDGETSVWTFSDVTEREDQAHRVQRAQGVYRALVAATQSLLHSSTEQGMIARLCQSLVAGTEFTSVWLGHPDDGGVFRVVGRASATEQDLSFLDTLQVRVDDPGAAIAQAWRARGVAVYQDNVAQQAGATYAPDLRQLRWAATLAAVVRRGGQPWGVLVYLAEQVGWFDDTTRQACEQVAALLGHGLDELDHKAAMAALQQHESRRARTDALTGLPNRLALGEHLPGALARAQRHRSMVAVGVLDLDDFKPVNDRYGHAAGDDLLRQLAGALRARLRAPDYLARIGGDEFVVLFEDIGARHPLSELLAALERLHSAVEVGYAVGDGHTVRVGMTMGLALYPHHADEADALLRLADAALYSGKARKLDRDQWWTFAPQAGAAVETGQRPLDVDPFGAEAQALLGGLDAATLEVVATRFTELFYTDLTATADLAPILQSLGDDEFSRLKQSQGRHLRLLLQAQATQQQIEQRARELGAIHALVGVSSARMEKSFALYEDLLRTEFERAAVSTRERYRMLRVTTARLRLDLLVQLDAIDRTTRRYAEVLGTPVSSGARWVDVLPAIVERLGALPGMRCAVVFRPDEHGALVDAMAAGSGAAALTEGLRARQLRPSLTPTSAGAFGPLATAWFSQTVQVVDSCQRDARLERWRPLADAVGWRSAALLPLSAGDQPESVLALLGAYPRQFSSDWAQSWLGALHHRLNALFASTARGYQPIDAARMHRYRELLYGGGLRVWMQPIVDLQSGTVVKAEALARLQSADGEVHAPAAFLPAFGEQQLQALFLQGLEQALDWLHRWREAGLAIDISVNLPPSTLLHPDCASWVEGALREARVAPQHLTLEILESENLDHARADEAIHALSRLGVHIALDDLGAGYSSLTRLASLPIDTVKIDQALVRELPKDPLRTVRLLSTLLRIGREFAPITVVEGLEDAGHIETTRMLGARYGQGYGLARPMPAETFAPWAARRPVTPADDTALHGWLGALAHHWRLEHDREQHALRTGALATCPLTHLLRARGVDDDDVLRWHAQFHELQPGGARDAAAQALLQWLAAATQHALQS